VAKPWEKRASKADLEALEAGERAARTPIPEPEPPARSKGTMHPDDVAHMGPDN
jgi:hypothetical protein